MEKDIFLDHPCFIIGNGPSINDIGDDLLQVEPFFTIGINRSFYKIDTSVLIWQDLTFWNTEKKRLEKLKALKFNRIQEKIEERMFKYERIGNPFHMTTTPRKLYGTGATGPLAFQLAALFGCNPVILIGFDCCYRGRHTNFYGRNRFHHDNTLDQCKEGLQWIKSVSHKRRVKIRIINCSLNEAWGHKPFDETMNEMDPKWKLGNETYRKMLLDKYVPEPSR